MGRPCRRRLVRRCGGRRPDRVRQPSALPIGDWRRASDDYSAVTECVRLMTAGKIGALIVMDGERMRLMSFLIAFCDANL